MSAPLFSRMGKCPTPRLREGKISGGKCPRGEGRGKWPTLSFASAITVKWSTGAAVTTSDAVYYIFLLAMLTAG